MTPDVGYLRVLVTQKFNNPFRASYSRFRNHRWVWAHFTSETRGYVDPFYGSDVLHFVTPEELEVAIIYAQLNVD